METDSLLWEKLQGAKFSRKLLKPDEEEERLKTGILLDLSRENGHLEFRQVERSVYKTVPEDHRLLVLWRLRLMGPNHFLLTVKIPDNSIMEYLYEYDLKNGLREVALKNVDLTKNKKYKNTWKSGERYTTMANTYTDKHQQTQYIIQPTLQRQHYSESRYNPQEQISRRNQKTATRTYLHKPAARYYTIVGYQTSPISEHQYTTWNQDAGYYTNTHTKSLPEFNTETEYSGFIPSLGPTGSPISYTGRVNEPGTFRPVSNIPTYSPEQTTQKPYSLAYFKPSTQFIQYSEIDPFYTSNDTYTYSLTPPTSIPIINENVAPYPQLVYNTQTTPSISVQAPQTEPGLSLYEITVNAIKNENKSQEHLPIENSPLPSVTSITYDYIQEIDKINETPLDAENQKRTTEAFITVNQNNNKTKSRIKNTLRNPQINQNKGYYDYAPLYIQWGNKIKPNLKISTSTEQNKEGQQVPIMESNTELTKANISSERNRKSNQTGKLKEAMVWPSERLQELQKQRHSLNLKNQDKLKLNNTLSIENKSSEAYLAKENKVLQSENSFPSFETTTLKTPEEVVRDLTTLGLIENADSSVNLRSTSEKKPRTSSDKYEIDTKNLTTEPVSVVVNRISQSVSYKTSIGQTKSVNK